MANTSMGLGAFASGMANGIGMGMKYQDRQNSAEQAAAATEKQQADKSANAGATPPAAAGTQPAGLGQSPQGATGQAPQGANGGAQPWSFIGSMFGGGGNV